jgi:hypothetical protein
MGSSWYHYPDLPCIPLVGRSKLIGFGSELSRHRDAKVARSPANSYAPAVQDLEREGQEPNTYLVIAPILLLVVSP